MWSKFQPGSIKRVASIVDIFQKYTTRYAHLYFPPLQQQYFEASSLKSQMKKTLSLINPILLPHSPTQMFSGQVRNQTGALLTVCILEYSNLSCLNFLPKAGKGLPQRPAISTSESGELFKLHKFSKQRH